MDDIVSIFGALYDAKNYQNNLPSYFKKIKSSGQYGIYENTLNLPSVKVTDSIYNSKN